MNTPTEHCHLKLVVLVFCTGPVPELANLWLRNCAVKLFTHLAGHRFMLLLVPAPWGQVSDAEL